MGLREDGKWKRKQRVGRMGKGGGGWEDLEKETWRIKGGGGGGGGQGRSGKESTD